MGAEQSLHIDKFPHSLEDMYKIQHNNSTPRSHNHTSLFLWAILPTTDAVKEMPVAVETLNAFDGQWCYLALFLSPPQQSSPRNSPQPACTSQPAGHPHKSLLSLVQSSLDALTPRGLADAFGTINWTGYSKSSTTLTHSLYLWSGKRAAPLVKATALAQAFKLEKLCTTTSVLQYLHSRATVPVHSLFNNDINGDLPAGHDLLKKLIGKDHYDQSKEKLNLFQHFEICSGAKQDCRSKSPEHQDTIDLSTNEHIALSPGSLIKLYEPQCSKITDFIYLGSRIPAENKKVLKENKITHIINCAGLVCKNHFPNDFVYKTLYLFDTPNQDISYLFWDIIDFMQEVKRQNGRVYVHCQQGTSNDYRSETQRRFSVVCNGDLLSNVGKWLAFSGTHYVHKSLIGQRTHEFVKNLRPIASPNAGFIVQLLKWWKRLREPLTPPRLYRVAPHSSIDPNYLVTKFIDLSEKGVRSLDPRTCFLLRSESKTFLWIGSECPEGYVLAAKKSLNQLEKYEQKDHVPLVELRQGEETEEFWKTHGDHKVERVSAYDQEYGNLQHPPQLYHKLLEAAEPLHGPKPVLFLFTGKDFEEYEMFDSDDLDDSELFILYSNDSSNIVYIWIGETFQQPRDFSGSVEKYAQHIGERFLTAKKELVHSPTMEVIRQGQEPNDFWEKFING